MGNTLDFRKQSCLSSFITFANENFHKHNLGVDYKKDLEIENFFNLLIEPRVGPIKSIDEKRQICLGYLFFMDYVEHGQNKNLILYERRKEFEKIMKMVEGNEGYVDGTGLNIELYNYLKLKSDME